MLQCAHNAKEWMKDSRNIASFLREPTRIPLLGDHYNTWKLGLQEILPDSFEIQNSVQRKGKWDVYIRREFSYPCFISPHNSADPIDQFIAVYSKDDFWTLFSGKFTTNEAVYSTIDEVTSKVLEQKAVSWPPRWLTNKIENPIQMGAYHGGPSLGFIALEAAGLGFMVAGAKHASPTSVAIGALMMASPFLGMGAKILGEVGDQLRCNNLNPRFRYGAETILDLSSERMDNEIVECYQKITDQEIIISRPDFLKAYDHVHMFGEYFEEISWDMPNINKKELNSRYGELLEILPEGIKSDTDKISIIFDNIISYHVKRELKGFPTIDPKPLNEE